MSIKETTNEELDRKLRRVTDELDLIGLVATIGPASDSVSTEVAVDLWTEDGIYEVPGIGCWTGREQLRGMFGSEQLRALSARGAAHVLSVPRIVITGDRAIGTCYSRLYVRSSTGVDVSRVAANRFEFVRTNLGWRIRKRLVLAVDGSEKVRELLAQGLTDNC